MVGDNHRCVGGEGLEQATAGAGHGLDIGEVADTPVLEADGVVRHPIEDESVESIAGPGIVGTERFENQEGQTEVPGPLGGALEAEVEPTPPC
jgi:hypothetical protein